MIAKTNRLGLLAAVVGLLAAVGLRELMVVVEAQPAGATFPGKNGKITYVTLTAPAARRFIRSPPMGAVSFESPTPRIRTSRGLITLRTARR